MQKTICRALSLAHLVDGREPRKVALKVAGIKDDHVVFRRKPVDVCVVQGCAIFTEHVAAGKKGK